jgi:hypothetical protein
MQIFDEILAVDHRNLRMLAADCTLVEYNVALWMPAENCPLIGQRYPLSNTLAVKKFQHGHGGYPWRQSNDQRPIERWLDPRAAQSVEDPAPKDTPDFIAATPQASIGREPSTKSGLIIRSGNAGAKYASLDGFKARPYA